MERQRNDLLAEIARDAALERAEFLARSGEQLERFLRDQAGRIGELGGLTLIDDDPDYLAIAPDGTFRSRSRVFDESTGEWLSETEIIETGGELVELYNPADVLQAFADAARDAVWTDGNGSDTNDSPTPAFEIAGNGADPYAGAADQWAAGQPDVPRVDSRDGAAAALYDLALDFQERSQRSEAGLLEQFENAASALLGRVGTIVIVDDLDEHLELAGHGFRGRVIPEGDSRWSELDGPDDVVRYYDPTDVFGDLAEAISEAFPGVGDEHEDEEAEADDLADEDDEDDGEGDDDLDEDDDLDAEDDAPEADADDDRR